MTSFFILQNVIPATQASEVREVGEVWIWIWNYYVLIGRELDTPTVEWILIGRELDTPTVRTSPTAGITFWRMKNDVIQNTWIEHKYSRLMMSYFQIINLLYFSSIQVYFKLETMARPNTWIQYLDFGAEEWAWVAS